MSKKLLLTLAVLLISALLLPVSYAGTKWSIETVDAGDLAWDTSIAVDSSGNPHISYLDGANLDLKYAKWTGSAWDKQTVDSAGNIGGYTSIAVDSSGNPHISYYDATNGDLKYAKWTGSAWDKQTVDSAGNVGLHTSIAVDSSGNPHISYNDATNGDLKYAKWTGSAWDKQTVDSAGDVGKGTCIDLDVPGDPNISYYDGTNLDLKYARLDAAGLWFTQTVDSEGDVGAFNSLAMDFDNRPHISYYDRTKGDLKYANWTGSAWDKQTVDSAGDVGRWTSIDLTSFENPHISYCNYTGFDLKYAKWTGSAWIIQTVDSAGNVGADTSIAVFWGTVPRISYYDATNADLKYAVGQYANPTGSIVINGGDASTSSTSVTLSLTYEAYGSSVFQVRYSNDGVWDSEVWESPAASKSWSLSSGDGTKTVYFQVKDSDELLSGTYWDTIVLSTTPSKVAAPTFSPSGGQYSSSQSVALSCSTNGATIRYTLDGSEPTASSTAYLSPISVGVTTTIKAKAFKSGMTDSDTATATYTITMVAQLAAPTFSPVGGTYSSSQNVALSCTTSDATIRYTTDGSEPSSASTVYSSPILISSTMTIKAKAFKSGMTDSDTATATYTIEIAQTTGFLPLEAFYAIAAAIGIVAIAATAIVLLRRQRKRKQTAGTA